MQSLGIAKTHCDFCEKPFGHYDHEKKVHIPEDHCRCYIKHWLVGMEPPVEGKCHVCGIAKADKRYADDCTDFNHGGVAFPWCLECIAAYRIEQALKSVRAMYDAMDAVGDKSGYEAYAALNDVWMKTVDGRLPLE